MYTYICIQPHLDEPHDGAWGAVGVVVARQLAHLGHGTIQRLVPCRRRCGEAKQQIHMHTDTQRLEVTMTNERNLKRGGRAETRQGAVLRDKGRGEFIRDCRGRYDEVSVLQKAHLDHSADFYLQAREKEYMCGAYTGLMKSRWKVYVWSCLPSTMGSMVEAVLGRSPTRVDSRSYTTRHRHTASALKPDTAL